MEFFKMKYFTRFLMPMMISYAQKVTDLKIHLVVKEIASCLDYMHVQWENCPCNMGKEGVPKLVVEVCCNFNLFFDITNAVMQEHCKI